jgi:hypothetical protein
MREDFFDEIAFDSVLSLETCGSFQTRPRAQPSLDLKFNSLPGPDPKILLFPGSGLGPSPGPRKC